MATTEIDKRSLENARKATTAEEILQAIMVETDEEEELTTDEEDPARMELDLLLSSNPDK